MGGAFEARSSIEHSFAAQTLQSQGGPGHPWAAPAQDRNGLRSSEVRNRLGGIARPVATPYVPGQAKLGALVLEPMVASEPLQYEAHAAVAPQKRGKQPRAWRNKYGGFGWNDVRRVNGFCDFAPAPRCVVSYDSHNQVKHEVPIWGVERPVGEIQGQHRGGRRKPRVKALPLQSKAPALPAPASAQSSVDRRAEADPPGHTGWPGAQTESLRGGTPRVDAGGVPPLNLASVDRHMRQVGGSFSSWLSIPWSRQSVLTERAPQTRRDAGLLHSLVVEGPPHSMRRTEVSTRRAGQLEVSTATQAVHSIRLHILGAHRAGSCAALSAWARPQAGSGFADGPGSRNGSPRRHVRGPASL